MNHCQTLSGLLGGRAVFDDRWVVGAFISQSLLSACFELQVPGSGMPKRRLLVIDLDSISDRPVDDIYSAVGGLDGLVPFSRKRIIRCETGSYLLLDTPMPTGNADRRLTAYSAAKLGYDISGAIASLQSAGIVHRNIKPRNIVLVDDRWMLDGLEMADFIRNTGSQSSIGTLMYMPAEALGGFCDYTTDTYSLASVMYNILNNDRPAMMGRYDSVTEEAVEQAIARRMNGEQIPHLMYVDSELDRIIRKAMSHDPARRYSHASQMHTDLSNYLHTADRQSAITNERATVMADAVMADGGFASQWQLGECLGSGTYGTVYRARSNMDGEEYALKLVRIPGDDNELKRLAASGMSPREQAEYCAQAIARASSEALMYMQLTGCDHILRMYDCGRVRTYNSSGVEFFWMQTELLSPIPASIPDERAVAAIALDVCAALSEIHSRGMTHRDVKPENILRTANGDFKLSDFGVARMLRETTEATVIGSRSYMAPEILSGLLENKKKKAYSNTVDIFSLGMTMYSLLNDDREPFMPPAPEPVTEADHALAEQRRLRGEPLPLPAHCGKRLGAIIARACANEPTRRFRTADDMREALLNYLEI